MTTQPGPDYEARATAKLERSRREAQRLAEELPDLDFDDVPGLLRWLERVPRDLDHVSVAETFPWNEAADAFEAHGYTAIPSLMLAWPGSAEMNTRMRSSASH